MKKLIYNKFDKKRIAELPLAVFGGKVIVVLSPSETEKAVNYLLSHSILGIDTETRPSFKKGHVNQVSLLQVSTHNTCFLFRLNITGMTPSILRFLEDTTVPKVGLSLHDDITALRKKISKNQRLTNWESDVLNEKQKAYAATDAWACIMLYEELMRLEQTRDYELIIVPESDAS